MNKNNLLINNFIPSKYLKKNLQYKLLKDYNKIFKEITTNINNPNKIFNILSKEYKFNFKRNDLQKFKKFENIIIIGMGGSILGSEAIYDFLGYKIKKKFKFLDNLDLKKISEIKKKNLKKTLFIVISKSGNTIETLSNTLTLNIIKKKAANIIIISEKGNILHSLSRKFNLFFIEHKKFIGGRYSVLSEVGIVPAIIMGINYKSLKKNSEIYLKNKSKFLKQSSIILSNLLLVGDHPSLVFLNYSPELNKFLYWCQQLIAESLGKKGKGFLPVVSNNPKDHHSLLQLYLGGPRDKIFYIFSIEDKLNFKLKTKKVSKDLNYLNNKNIKTIKKAQIDALIKILKLQKIPFRKFKINKLDERTLGELFSYFILETAIIGRLMKINPFNQPEVEQLKNLTKKNLT